MKDEYLPNCSVKHCLFVCVHVLVHMCDVLCICVNIWEVDCICVWEIECKYCVNLYVCAHARDMYIMYMLCCVYVWVGISYMKCFVHLCVRVCMVHCTYMHTCETCIYVCDVLCICGVWCMHKAIKTCKEDTWYHLSLGAFRLEKASLTEPEAWLCS